MSQDDLPLIADLSALFLRDRPLLDVRAPVEFAEGAFPQAENHPLIDDPERHAIGTEYAEHGQDEAIRLGERLVSGEIKAARIAAWKAYLRRHPDAVLYCFRGGLRSQTSQRWLFEEAQIRCPRVAGGYKAMRRFLLDQLEINSAVCKPVVIGGRTGVGKTLLLRACEDQIDLEALAHHRGSAFGHHPEPQPSQIDFENALSIDLMKQVAGGNGFFAVEDESKNIGSRHIPPVFYERLQAAPLILLEATLDERVETTLAEYVHEGLSNFHEAVGEAQAFDLWSDYLRSAIDRIRKRLGGERHQAVRNQLDAAIEAQRNGEGTAQHRAWITTLLRDYYDGMYEYQLAGKRERIVFSGPRDTVLDYLGNTYGIRATNPEPVTT